MAGRSDIRAGRAYVETIVRNSALQRGLRQAQAYLRTFGQGAKAMGLGLMKIGSMVMAPLLAAVKTFASMGDTLDKMSARIGTSVEFLSALGHAAQIGGSDITAMETGIRRLQRTAMDAGRGLSTAVDAFDEVGVSATDASGQLKGTEELFMETAAALSQVESETKKAALAQMLFGRAGTSLLPMLKDGKAGLLGVMEEAKRLGIVMSTEDATAAAVFTDQMTRLMSTLKRVAFNVGAALAGSFGDLSEWLTTIGKQYGEWIRANQESVVTVAKWSAAVIAAGGALVALGTVLNSTAAIIGVTATAVKALTAAITFLAAHPLVALAAVAVAAGLAVHKLTSYTAELRDEMSKATAAADQKRAADMQMMNRLSELAEKQRLTTAEMSEARGLISQLEERYGALGFSVDGVTGKLSGLSAAQAKVNKVMREAAIAQVEAEIKERSSNIEEMAREVGARDLLANVTGFLGMGPTEQEKEAALAKRAQAEAMHIQALQTRLAALKAGGTGALTGGAAAPGAAPSMAGLAGLVGGGPDLEAAGKRLDAWLEQRRQRRKQMEIQTDRDIAVAKIEATMGGHRKAVALLRLEKKEAIATAQALGLDPARVKELYRIRESMIPKGGEVVDLSKVPTADAIRRTAVGTFSAAQASLFGGKRDPSKQIVAALKHTAKINVDMLRELKRITLEATA